MLPIYLAIVFYAGYRFGERALIETAIASVAGFATVALATEFWRQQTALAVGLAAGLIFLPACMLGALRATAAARAAAAAAEAARERSLAAIADALRAPLAMMAGDAAEPSTRLLAERISDILDLVAIETRELSIPTEPFDLRALAKEILGPLSIAAAQNGIAMRWRIDPRLPSSMRGQPQAITRILGSLARHFIDAARSERLRIAFDAIERGADQVRLRIRIDAGDAPEAADVVAGGFSEAVHAAGWEHQALTVAVVTRLVARIGGDLSVEGGPGPPNRFVVTLSLAVEPRTREADLDLHGQPVLIVSGDETFAGELCSLLGRWHADARWIGDTETSVAEIAGLEPSERAVLLLDGRDRPLAALGFADSVRRLGIGAPFILFVGESSRIDRLAQLDEGALDCLLPVPLTERLVANALCGLALDMARLADRGSGGPHSMPANEAVDPGDERVTPIAVHPKFAPDTVGTLDARVIEALGALGGGEAFLRELIDSFRADARQLLERLDRAVVAADAAAFSAGLAALRRCARQLGGRRIDAVLPAALAFTDAELRQRGPLHVQRLTAEIDRLAAALQELLPAGEAAARF